MLCLMAMAQQKPAESAKTDPGTQPPAKKTDPAAKQDDNLLFTSKVQEVVLPVTVRDPKTGKFVSNLTAADFRVLDEGKAQRISVFNHAEKQPIVVGFLVDQSSDVRIHWDKFREAVKELIWTLLPGDPRYSGYLIQYNTKAELLVNTTTDSDKLSSVVDKMKPSVGAALFDAIYRACTDRALVKGEPYEPRRIIIIIGDGRDNASQKTLGEVLELAKRNQVTIYAMSTQNFGFDNPDDDALQALANQTGGHVEYPLNKLYADVSGYLSQPSDDGNYALTVGTGGYASEISSGIVKAVAGLAGEITTQYVIRYTPDIDPKTAGKDFRKIKVDIPSIPFLRPITRDGYYPDPIRKPTVQ
ncbi:MAG TPA: VWA domain-containing protein [Verrucomicrobiae bacterium]|nr:VWA domain-containing protein [Verrucomicrobiae bacterium]